MNNPQTYPIAMVATTSSARFEAVALRDSLESGVRIVKQIGFDGVELAIRDPRMINRASLRSVLEETQLPVVALGTGQAYLEEGLSLSHPDRAVRRQAVERVKSHVELSSELGRPAVIIGLIRGTLEKDVHASLALKYLTEALKQCAEFAGAAGVGLVVEPLNRYETKLINTVANGLELLADVACANVGLLLDTFHMNIEEPSLVASIEAAAPHIGHFHVADSNRWAPGWGHIDFAAIIAGLRSVGYGGFLSGEILPLPNAMDAAHQTHAHLRSLFPASAPPRPTPDEDHCSHRF
jgi:sugar phosphate isomerase/epimerase